MRIYTLGSICGALALSATVVAQAPQPPQGQSQATPPAARAQGQAQAVTVEGCLVREADVPGRKPNVAERAGIAEDYILTTTKMVKGSAPAAKAGAKAGMYEVEGLDDEQLKPHLGHRVQLDGTFENVDRASAPPERGTPADDLVEIRATAIRHVAANCPAK
jgi:hypothetical protein